MPERLKNYFTEQDEEYFSSQETDEVFISGKSRKKIMESKRKTSSSGASCYGISLCLYLALLAIFASPSVCIKLYGYGFDNIVSTKIYSLDHSTNCDNKIRVSKTIEDDVQLEIKLRFRMYEATYTLSALKKSNVYDDVVFITKNSRLLKSIYPLNERNL